MQSLKLYFDCQKISPRDPVYVDQLEKAAFAMAEDLKSLVKVLHNQIEIVEDERSKP